MSAKDKPKVTLESIDFQSGALYHELTEAVAALRKDGTYTEASMKRIDIPGIIKARTNMKVSFVVNRDIGYNAHIMPPMVDKNHPFMRDFLREYGDFSDGRKLLNAMGGKALGTVDRKRGRVDGVFANIEGNIEVGMDLIGGKMYTDGEIAAIILHECGHLFTYFEYLGLAFTTNQVMAAVSKACYETDDVKERKILLVKAESVLGITIKDKDSLAATAKPFRTSAVQAVILTSSAEKSRSELGTNIYDIRSWEQLSDQFAARHGAGKDLVTALDKLYRTSWHRSSMVTITYLALEVAKLIMFAGFIVVMLPTMLLLLLVTNPTEKVYDEPEARIRMIRQQIGEELKQKGLTDLRRKALLADLEAVKTVEEGLDDKRTFMELFWTTFTPWGRKAAEQETVQKQLEQLASNDLFVMSAKFKVGADHA